MKCDGLIAEKLSGECFGCEGGIYEVYGKEEVDEAIAELKEQLLATKRALWLARAERASEKADTFITFKVTYNGLCNINNSVWPEKGAKRMLECENWQDIWTHVWHLCTKKAEEYK